MNNCPNCGSNTNPGEAFCRVCGTKLSLPENNLLNNPQVSGNNQMSNVEQVEHLDLPNVNNTQMPNNNQVQGSQQIPNINNTFNSQNDMEVLTDAYIGKNADKLKKSSFSLCTLFFGTIYVFYRKMWLLGVIWLAISIIAGAFLPSYSYIVTILTNVIVATQFNKLYLKNVSEKVNKIVTENQGKSKEQLIMLCNQKGGTTIIPVVIYVGIIVLFFIISLVVYLTIWPSIKDELLNDSNNNINENYNTNTNNNNNNNQNNTSGVIGNLNLTIPSNMELQTNYDTIKRYATPYTSDGDDCELYLRVISYDTDAKKQLENEIVYSPSDVYSGITTTQVNNKSWYYATLTNSYSQNYYFSTLSNGSVYVIDFSVMDDDNKTCSTAFNTVVNSLRFN